MIPEIDTQLSAVIKSLQDNVLPAVEQGNAQAIEQLHLSLATLGVIKNHLPLLHRYQRRELEMNLSLVKSLADVVSEEGVTIENLGAVVWQSEEMLAESIQGATEIEQQVRVLKDVASSIVNTSRGSMKEKKVAAIILEAQEQMDLYRRAWTVGMGFEPDPAQIPPLEQLLE